ncbi:MAG: MFS transporter [Thermomicrobiales bacterium]|nr:MFS transporter [Thermomicrobiales bacterium]MCO5226424.1 MFS transporter [Thermomicrobiales bacterium]
MSSSFRDLLRDAPGFSTYFATASLARLANEGLRLALILTAANTEAGLRLGGLLVAAFLIPSIVAAPFVGRMADLSSKPTRLYAAAFLFNGFMIALCGLSIGVIPDWIILLLAAIGGSVGPLMQGGLSSLVGTIVPKPLLHRAYAMDVVTYNVSAILAPAIVAAIAGWITPLASLLFLAVIMVLASGNVLRLKIDQPQERAVIAVPSPIDGFKAIGSITPLRTTVVATSLASVSNGILPVAVTMMAFDTINVNAGTMLSTMAIGALIGSVSYAARPFGMARPHVMLPFVTLITAMPILLLTTVSNTPLALGLFALAGALGGPQGTAQFSVRDRFSPTNVRTQVFTLSTSLKTTFAAIGAALAGMLSGLSASSLLYIAVSCTITGAILALIDLRRHGYMSPGITSSNAAELA